jgi:excisionase family DNA binding protein
MTAPRPRSADFSPSSKHMNGTALEGLVDLLADAVADRIADRLSPPSQEPERWLNVDEAATYLACPASRVYDLVSRRRLRCARDGRRLLFQRTDLDAVLDVTDAGETE